MVVDMHKKFWHVGIIPVIDGACQKYINYCHHGFTLFCIRIFGFYMCQWFLVVFRIFGLGILTCQKLYDPFCMFPFTLFSIYRFSQISQRRSDVLISITISTVTKYVHFTQIFLDALKIYHDWKLWKHMPYISLLFTQSTCFVINI